MKFKLKDGIENEITVRYMEKHGVSRVYTSKTFSPGKIYGFEGDDDLARETLLSYRARVKKTEQVVNMLETHGIKYEYKKPTCNCVKTGFVEFNPVEEVNDESD